MDKTTTSDNNSELTAIFPISCTSKLTCILTQTISPDVKAGSTTCTFYTCVVHYVTKSNAKIHYVNSNGSKSVPVKVLYTRY